MKTSPTSSSGIVRALISTSTWLSRYTSLFIIAIAVFTFFNPSVFTWVQGDTQALLLGFIMLTMGMTLRPDDFRILASRPWDIFIGACAQYSIMPLLAWLLVSTFDLPKGVAVGLILVGCSPGGVSSNIMSFLCRGDLAYSVGMTTASTLLAPFMTPTLVLLLAGESIDVDAWGMFRSILFVTILPVAIGAIANKLFQSRAGYGKICQIMPGFSVLGLACIVGGVTAAHGASFIHSGSVIVVTVFLHNALGYLLGFLLGKFFRMNSAKCRTLSIEVGMQNAGLATVLATKHFPLLPEAAIVSALCCVWHSISGTLLAGLFNFIRHIFPSPSSPVHSKENSHVNSRTN